MNPRKQFKQRARKDWENRCIQYIHGAKNASRSELCDALGVSITTVNSVVSQLISDGVIEESGAGESRGGRKPGVLSIRPDSAFFIGLEFSADGIFCTVLDMDRGICYQSGRPFGKAQSAELLTDSLCEEIQLAIDSLGAQAARICGICLGVPGFVDYAQGVLVFYTQVKEWNNVPLKAVLSAKFAYPIYYRNNVDVMPYAYKWVTCNGVCEDHAIMIVRYGFKISSLANNQQIRGAYDFTGEIGHMHVDGSNRLCRCGKHGCFDTEVTYSAIKLKVEEGIKVGHFAYLAGLIKEHGDFSIGLFTDACNNGDIDSLTLMDETINALCTAISWVFYMNAPSAVMISSKLDKYTGFYKAINDTLYHQHENTFTYSKLVVKPAPFGEYIGAIGAAAYIYELCFGSQL